MKLRWVRGIRQVAQVPLARHSQVGLPAGYYADQQALDNILAEEPDEVRADHEARDDGADSDAGAIRWCLDDEALVLIVARILSLGHDLDLVADCERFGAAPGDGLFHERR